MALPSGDRFQVGAVDFTVVNDGTYYYDGGAVFGLVPRMLWERVAGPLDDRHRLTLGLNCLLLRSQGQTILIESGVGGKPGDRDSASPAEQGTLLDSLAALGVRPEEIDVVVNTHLHADHCGWNTSVATGSDGEEIFVPTFPNAKIVVNAKEWDDAMHPNERTRATYLDRNLQPIADRLELRDGEYQITDEVIFVPVPGHTDGHSSVLLRSGQEWGIYLGDMAQHRVQLERTAWVSALDVLPLVAMETKKKLMDECIEAGALVMFCHGAYPGVGRMTRTLEGFRKWEDVEPVGQGFDAHGHDHAHDHTHEDGGGHEHGHAH